MYQIKNVINYDKETLEQECEKDAERFLRTNEFMRLLRRGTWLPLAHMVTSRMGFVCSSCALVLAILEQSIMLSRILALAGLVLSSLDLFVLYPIVTKVFEEDTQEMSELLGTYCYTPAMRYHMFVAEVSAEDIEIWGTESKDSKFEVVLSKIVDGKIEKETLILDYDSRNESGVLTLDVQNGVVLRR